VVRKGGVLLAQVCIHYSVLRRITDLACFDEDIEESVTIYAKHVQLGLVYLYCADYDHASCTAVQAVQCLLHLMFGMD
jgi:hypothetical protein